MALIVALTQPAPARAVFACLPIGAAPPSRVVSGRITGLASARRVGAPGLKTYTIQPRLSLRSKNKTTAFWLTAEARYLNVQHVNISTLETGRRIGVITVTRSGSDHALALVDHVEGSPFPLTRSRWPFVAGAHWIPGTLEAAIDLKGPSSLRLSYAPAGRQARQYVFATPAHIPLWRWQLIAEPGWDKGAYATALISQSILDCAWEADIVLVDIP